MNGLEGVSGLVVSHVGVVERIGERRLEHLEVLDLGIVGKLEGAKLGNPGHDANVGGLLDHRLAFEEPEEVRDDNAPQAGLKHAHVFEGDIEGNLAFGMGAQGERCRARLGNIAVDIRDEQFDRDVEQDEQAAVLELDGERNAISTRAVGGIRRLVEPEGALGNGDVGKRKRDEDDDAEQRHPPQRRRAMLVVTNDKRHEQTRRENEDADDDLDDLAPSQGHHQTRGRRCA